MKEKYLHALLFLGVVVLFRQVSSLVFWILFPLYLLGFVGVYTYIEKKRRKQTWDLLTHALPPSMVVGTHSIEELRQRVLEIWTEREQMDLVLSEIREGVLAISPDDIVLLANDRARDILNLKEDVIGDDVSKKQFPKPVRTVLKAALKQDVTERVWKEGDKPGRRYFELLGFPMKESLGALLVIRDITKLRRLERVRRDFIANISHELRTPVSVILMNVETLLAEKEMDASTQRRFLGAIQRNSTRLSRLLNDLLDLSSIEAGQYTLDLQDYNLLPIMEQVSQNLEERYRAKNQQVVIERNKNTELHAFCDREAVEQILTNLVENAIKYTPEGSTIRLRTIEEEDVLCIEVEDNGLGILAKHQPRLFERFYRVDKGRSLDAGGTGLGLSIVRHLTDIMGGEVGMRTAESGGSIFWVRLLIE